MAAFVVVATLRPAPKLERSIVEHTPPLSALRLDEGAWLVDYEGTSQELAEALNVRRQASDERRTEPAVTFRIANYSGFASTQVWEWLGEHMNRVGE